MSEIQDETLVQYLDGMLPEDQHAEVKAAIAADPALAARVAELSVDFDRLRQGMSLLLDQAPAMPRPTAPVVSLPAPRMPVWQYAAAAVVIFALGLGAGRMLPGGVEPGGPGAGGWHQAVADYQVLYTTETLTAVPMGADLRARGLERTGAALGLPLTQSSVEIPGLTFQRAQILQIDGAPLAQLVYLDQSGTPVAFCITRRDGADEAPRHGRLSGLEVRTWREAGYGFILIGDVETAVLQKAERDLRSKIAL